MDLLTQTAWCGSNACGRVSEQPDGSFLFTSTFGDSSGQLSLSAEETAQFFADVKAGKFDGVHRRARDLTDHLI